MPREAELYEESGGSVLEGYFLLKQRGGNIPPLWIERSKESRQNRQKHVAATLRGGKWAEIAVLRDWENAYRKECFYNGIRVLFELERHGRSHR